MPAQRRDAHVRWYFEDCMPFVTHPSVTHVPSLKCHLCTRLYGHRCRLRHRDTREAPTEAVTARRSNWPHAAVTIPRTISSRLTGASGAKKRVSVASVRCGRWRCGVAHSVMCSTVLWRYTPGSGRRVHHAGGGDRPDPRPPPRPPCDDGPRRRAEFPIHAGPPRTEVRHAPPARPPRGAGEVGHRTLCSTGSQAAPIEIPIPNTIRYSRWRSTRDERTGATRARPCAFAAAVGRTGARRRGQSLPPARAVHRRTRRVRSGCAAVAGSAVGGSCSQRTSLAGDS